tara:strand:+ start:281 stop:529 length:249 start_codon:yes stop_codon:yes gene_type:complete
MSKKTDLENIKRIVEEEAIEVFVEYNAQFEFHHFCNDLKTVFVYQLPETEVEVDFKMTKNLERKLKELSKRYTVGIFYQSKK